MIWPVYSRSCPWFPISYELRNKTHQSLQGRNSEQQRQAIGNILSSLLPEKAAARFRRLFPLSKVSVATPVGQCRIEAMKGGCFQILSSQRRLLLWSVGHTQRLTHAPCVLQWSAETNARITKVSLSACWVDSRSPGWVINCACMVWHYDEKR